MHESLVRNGVDDIPPGRDRVQDGIKSLRSVWRSVSSNACTIQFNFQ